jgi:glutaminyl-tRNA synthetase
MTVPADKETQKTSNFLRQVIERDLEQGTYAQRHWSGRPGDAAQ